MPVYVKMTIVKVCLALDIFLQKHLKMGWANVFLKATFLVLLTFKDAAFCCRVFNVYEYNN